MSTVSSQKLSPSQQLAARAFAISIVALFALSMLSFGYIAVAENIPATPPTPPTSPVTPPEISPTPTYDMPSPTATDIPLSTLTPSVTPTSTPPATENPFAQAVSITNHNYYDNNFVGVMRGESVYLKDDFTVEFWVYLQDSPRYYGRSLLHVGSNLNIYIHRGVDGYQNNLSASFGDGVNSVFMTGPNLELNKWHHVAVTFDKTGTDMGTASLYANGTMIIKQTDVPFRDGGYAFEIGEHLYEGSMDEFRVSRVSRYASGNNSYSVPVLPFIPDNNTLMLLHFNGNIEDSATVGEAYPWVNGTVDFILSTVPYLYPTNTPTPTLTPTATLTPTNTLTATLTPTLTKTPTPTVVTNNIPRVVTGLLANAKVNVPYFAQIKANDLDKSDVLTLTATNVPSGLILKNCRQSITNDRKVMLCDLTGKPTKAGVFSITFTVKDSKGAISSRKLSLTVVK